MAMENDPFINDFPIKTSIYSGFSMAVLNNQRVTYFYQPQAHRTYPPLRYRSGQCSQLFDMTLWLCQTVCYSKWPFIVDVPIKKCLFSVTVWVYQRVFVCSLHDFDCGNIQPLTMMIDFGIHHNKPSQSVNYNRFLSTPKNPALPNFIRHKSGML